MSGTQIATSEQIKKLVDRLSSKDMFERMEARAALVEAGANAVPAIVVLADSPRPQLRWECAKALAAIADVSSVDTLIRLLEDSDEGTRWDAALGLIKIGQPAVTPLLRAVMDRSIGFAIVAGARHVTHEWSRTSWGGFLAPVYDALNRREATVSGPVAASRALEEWEYMELSRPNPTRQNPK